MSNTDSIKIYVAGHRGMVGSAIVRQLAALSAPGAFIPDQSGVIAGSDPQSMPPEVPVVRIDPRYFRPAEFETLLGDPSKAKQKLGWTPEITDQKVCAEMVAADLAKAQKHAMLKHHGYDSNVSVE